VENVVIAGAVFTLFQQEAKNERQENKQAGRGNKMTDEKLAIDTLKKGDKIISTGDAVDQSGRCNAYEIIGDILDLPDEILENYYKSYNQGGKFGYSPRFQRVILAMQFKGDRYGPVMLNSRDIENSVLVTDTELKAWLTELKAWLAAHDLSKDAMHDLLDGKPFINRDK